MKRVAFSTLGCKVNQYDTDVMKASFIERGYSCVSFSEEADIYVVNTCTVTAVAARKSRQMATKARKTNPSALVAVTGCLGQLESEKVMEMTGADIVTGNVEKNSIVDIIEEHESESILQSADIFEQSDYNQNGDSSQDTRTRIFIKVQDGCDNYCSYCVIPFARGRSRSRQPEKVLSEIKKYADAGAQEVVITGIHLDSYGKDLENITLIDLLEKIDSIHGIKRVRLGSLEPASVTEEFAKRAAELTKLCPHFHLSLQSGCNSVLQRMKRKYTASEFSEATALLKRYFSSVTLTTDIIVGFPGETDEEFKESLVFVEKIGFLKVHVFKFSPRKGTLAYGMKDKIPGDIKKIRSEKMITATDVARKNVLNSIVGTMCKVLVEKKHNKESDMWEGHTSGYIKVIFKCHDCGVNDILNVKIDKIMDEFVLGCLK
ncbi:MAG: tRNA (N(6)-L-threonylcarbamoyladenosine(37)-C(2))-methylthiotransferase MtaB [Clostridiales bacterium]|nr:tRNA (N(6)-L-threonylcarbamoyladenosine(37)-C(2))-methylthiotransferase MtaB [Clostridiales bacterium]